MHTGPPWPPFTHSDQDIPQPPVKPVPHIKSESSTDSHDPDVGTETC
jgi:hypothetical protein